MVRFVLHIGDGKCGSSSIQAALHSAQRKLEQRGILYRANHRANGHFAFVTLLGASTRGNDERGLKSSQEDIHAIRQRLLSGDISHVILSGENFLRLPPGQVLKLMEMMCDRIDGFDVIAYVREPASMYLSWLQQELKGNHRVRQPERYSHPVDLYVSNWVTTIGRENVFVRPFDKTVLYGGSVVHDFTVLLRRITQEQIELDEYSENASLSSEQMVVLQRYRARYLAASAGKRISWSDRLIRLFHDLNAVQQIGNKPELKAHWTNLIRANSAQTFSRLAEAFPDCRVLIKSVDSFDSSFCASRPSDVRTIIASTSTELVRLLGQLVRAPDTKTQGLIPDTAKKAMRVLQRRYCLHEERTSEVLSQYWNVD